MSKAALISGLYLFINMESLFNRLLAYYHINEEDYALLTMDVNEDNFASGHSFKQMEQCVQIVKDAMAANKKIFIYGDYDADGIMSVSILAKMFKMLNYPVAYHIPNRYTDGYGLNLQRSQEIVENGYELLITVDNGITAFDGIEYAKEHGLQVLVFDHHQPGEALPVCDGILHPSVSELGETATSAGFVTFMFTRSFLGYFDYHLATLASISLVSDMMPLVSYNRNLLRLLIKEYDNHPSLSVDLLREKDPFNEVTIGMRIAPKINAIGRLIDEDILLSRTVEFFVSDDQDLLLNYNEWINQINLERKEVTKEAVENSKDIDVEAPAIIGVIAQKEGIIGLIANNFVKKYHKPTIIFALDSTGEVYKGSARSPEGLNIVDTFAKLSEYLEAYGGHAMAGGCSVKKENFEAFKKAFIEIARDTKVVKQEVTTIPLYINEITLENYELIKSFSPFGECWASPCFSLPRIRVASLMYSRDSQHILTSIGNSARLTGFYFSKEKMSEYQFVDMLGTLRLSTYYNKTTVEFLINEINETK